MSIKIALIGGSNIAEKHILPTLLKMQDVYTVVCLCTSRKSRAVELEEKFGISVVTNYEEVRKLKPDLVYCSLPNSRHFEVCQYFLNYNVHVVCEKALTCDYKQTKELVELASQRGVIISENFQFVYHDQFEFIKKLHFGKTLGDIRSITAKFGFPPFADANNIRYSKKLGGGSLWDAACYPCHIVTQLEEFVRNYRCVSTLNHDLIHSVDTYGSFCLVNDHGLAYFGGFGFDNKYQCELDIWYSAGRVKAERVFTAPPGQLAIVSVENGEGVAQYKFENCNHFEKKFLDISHKILIPAEIMRENKVSLRQAELMRMIVNGR